MDILVEISGIIWVGLGLDWGEVCGLDSFLSKTKENKFPQLLDVIECGENSEKKGLIKCGFGSRESFAQ